MSSIRNRILSIVAILSVGLLLMGLLGIYQTHRLAVEAEDALDRLKLVTALVDTTRSAQHHFKIQVQEWKNVLIRGGDPALYDKYWKGFEKEEQTVADRLARAREAAARLNVAARFDIAPAEAAMKESVGWLESLPGHPVFVGYPASFDFLVVYWYPIRLAGRSPFSFAALDIKTMAMVMLGRDYRRTVKGAMPRRWFDDLPHRHRALDDAIEQGTLFCNMLADSRKG